MGNWKHFDRYGNPLWNGNTAEKNRKALTRLRCRPENKPRGGYRGKPKVRVSV